MSTTQQHGAQAAAAKPADKADEHKLPEREKAEAFIEHGAAAPKGPPPGYPKLKFHPVFGGVEVKDPVEEAALGHGWSETPELADASRTHLEAELVRLNGLQAKLKELTDKKHHLVAGSAQAEEAMRRAQIGQS